MVTPAVVAAEHIAGARAYLDAVPAALVRDGITPERGARFWLPAGQCGGGGGGGTNVRLCLRADALMSSRLAIVRRQRPDHFVLLLLAPRRAAAARTLRGPRRALAARGWRGARRRRAHAGGAAGGHRGGGGDRGGRARRTWRSAARARRGDGLRRCHGAVDARAKFSLVGALVFQGWRAQRWMRLHLQGNTVLCVHAHAYPGFLLSGLVGN
jgi:hypothetical protein